jgi:hypothetical protein
VTLLPATRAHNPLAARRPLGWGSAAALRAGSRGPLHPATDPPIWAGRAAARPAPALSSHRCALMSARWRLRRLA